MEELPRKHEGGTNQQPAPADQLAAIENDAGRREQPIDDGIEAGAAADRTVDDWPEQPIRSDRLRELDAHLRPLSDLGDIPRPPWGRSAESGYDWMERLPRGWHVEPSWGRDGWDLGAWPLVAVALFTDEDHGRYALATYTEGDVTVQRYASRGALYVAVNELAEFHWRLGQSRGPSDLPEGKGLLAKHCGPFSEERLRREKAADQPARESRPPRGAGDE